MDRPVVCYYHCPRCKAHFDAWKQKPFIALPGVTSWSATCRECGKKHVQPYRKEYPGSRGYSLPMNPP